MKGASVVTIFNILAPKSRRFLDAATFARPVKSRILSAHKILDESWQSRPNPIGKVSSYIKAVI